MTVLMVTPEAAPFSRTGGLGDVLGALPAALVRLGHAVTVCTPWYGEIDTERFRIRRLPWRDDIRAAELTFAVEYGRIVDEQTRVEFILVNCPELFEREGLYQDPATGRDWPDNDIRFVVFNRAALCLATRLSPRPQVVHCHDWQAALIPALLRTGQGGELSPENCRTVLTIHNLGYQGLFPSERWRYLGLPDEMLTPVTGAFEFYGQVNFLKGGIALADRLTTVSPRYAREICESEELGCGLQGLLAQRSSDLVGILNGVDYSTWSPSRDRKIPFRYHLKNLSGKRMNKVELVRRCGLPFREHAPLIGMVTRLTEQKGLDLLAGAADELLEMNVQLVVLGTGEERYHQLLQSMERRRPDKVKAFLTFDDELAHWIEAGADVFLMPSRYEPCGLNQMYSLRYGTVPVVRKVGGLADTVIDVDDPSGAGNGFVFEEYSAAAMLQAIRRAAELFPHRRRWMRLMKAGMRLDFSWDRSARRYAALYHSLAGAATPVETPGETAGH